VCNIHLIEDIHVFLDKNTLETIVIKEGFVFQFLHQKNLNEKKGMNVLEEVKL
jgi:hypothetical protein